MNVEPDVSVVTMDSSRETVALSSSYSERSTYCGGSWTGGIGYGG